ncbi:protein huluwa [Pholidichthys leucotaenia]
MSHPSQPTSSTLTGDHLVANLTLVVLLLVPCVVLVLLLNCFFLGYKLLVLSRRSTSCRVKQEHREMLLPQRVRLADLASSPLQGGGTAFTSPSEPVLTHPVTSSRTSSRERLGLLRPDWATGSGSLRPPSTIQATSPAGWCRSAPVLPQNDASGTETRVAIAPPESPMNEGEYVGLIHRSSTYDNLAGVNPGAAVFDKVEAECETSCLNSSAVGPGLDSDFGASAGVSLRILSADSDCLSNGVLASTLEWDYYDPCYVKQNNVPKHQHCRPAIHTKQYWV